MVSGSVAKLTPAPPSKYETMPMSESLHAHTHAGYTRLNKDIFIILLRFMMLLLDFTNCCSFLFLFLFL